MSAPRLVDWGPTPENPAGRPHLKPRVGVHQEQRLVATPTGSKLQTPRRHYSGPKPLEPPARKTQSQSKPSATQDSGLELQTSQPHQPRPQAEKLLINGLATCDGTTPKSTGFEQLLPSPCPQSPAGPTGSLGRRQNTQQRGAAGLWETAFPRKTRPSRGLNYSIPAPRAPSI